MARNAKQIDVYLEVGKSKTFATALDWPGWSRSGRGEEAALQALFDYGPRYARVLQSTQLGFIPPSDVGALVVVERKQGNATTDFGAPNLPLPGDSEPVSPDELERWKTILQACWRAFDETVAMARGKALAKGPRGGGRELEKIVEHVGGATASYLTSLGGKAKPGNEDDPSKAFAPLREAILTTLDAAVRGEIPPRGPRGGERWTTRYFVRRLAWHDLDHVWEIEDRLG